MKIQKNSSRIIKEKEKKENKLLAELFPQNPYVEILIPHASECNCIWR